jgi:hypothetical protein
MLRHGFCSKLPRSVLGALPCGLLFGGSLSLLPYRFNTEKLGSSYHCPANVANITNTHAMLLQSQEVATWKQAAVCKEGVAIQNSSNGKRRTVNLRPSNSKRPPSSRRLASTKPREGVGTVRNLLHSHFSHVAT